VIALGGPDPAEDRHAQVHQDHVGLHRLGEADRLLPVAGLGDHLQLRVHRQRGLDAIPGQRMVVGHEDANDIAHTAPSPADSSIWIVPLLAR
jgi:hypothetical protein